MSKMVRSGLLIAVLLTGALFILSGCGNGGSAPADNKTSADTTQEAPDTKSSATADSKASTDASKQDSNAKLTTVTFKSDDPAGSISVSYPEGSSYTFVDAAKDGTDKLRTSRDDAGVCADSFLVTFEAYDYFSSSDNFNTTKQGAQSKEQFKEVTYNSIAGFSYYYPENVGYIVCLPVNDDCYMRIGVFPRKGGEWFSAEQESDAKAAYESAEVQSMLNTIKVS